jgi:hypothetical protein
MFYLLFFSEYCKYFDSLERITKSTFTDPVTCVLIQNDNGENFITSPDNLSCYDVPIRKIVEPTFHYTLGEFKETKNRILSIQKGETISNDLLKKVNRLAIVFDHLSRCFF